MSMFPTPKHLASWAGMCPGNNESGGKRRSGKTRNGSKWLRATLSESANAAARSKNTYLAAQYARLRGRRGHAKAITAVGHSILTAAWHMLQTGDLYRDLGSETSPDRIPTARPDGSSDSSKRSATSSPSKRQRQRRRARAFPADGISLQE